MRQNLGGTQEREGAWEECCVGWRHGWKAGSVLRAEHAQGLPLTHRPAGVQAERVLQDLILIPPSREFTGTTLTFHQMFIF